MSDVTIIGVDIAKQSFQVRGAGSDGSVAFQKKLTRGQVLPFLAEQPMCIVAMEACATAQYWGRQIMELGHEVKLLPAQYVKPYVKRQKNDRADAGAIAEAAIRSTMRFVEVKSTDRQSRATLFGTRQVLVARRTQTINALRGHMAEYGVIGPKSKAGQKKLIAALDDETNGLPDIVRDVARSYVEHIETLAAKISDLTKQLETIAKSSGKVQRLKTMPGVGLQTALEIEAFAPDMSCFEQGRDFGA